MKISGRNADTFARAPGPNVRAVLVYGPDSGLVGERAATLARAGGADPEDPFATTTLREEDLAGAPGRLLDEAAAIPWGGGVRVVRVRGASDALAPALSALLERPPEGAFVVVEAGDLGPRSRVRRLFEGAARGAAVPCYPDDDDARARLIRETLRAGGKEIEPAALEYLSRRLGGDRALARRELDKLALYALDRDGAVTREMAAECVGDEAERALEDVALAAAAGDVAELARAWDRVVAAGQRDVAVLRALARHLQRLHAVSVARDSGASVERAMAALRPPVFFRSKAAFAAQIAGWTTARIEEALDAASRAERSCKTTGTPGGLVCERTLFRIAGAARRGRARTR